MKIGDQEAWGLMARNRNLMGIGELDGPLHKKSIRVIFNGVVRTGQQIKHRRDLYRSFEWQRQLQRERQGWRGWEFDESDFIIDTLKHIVPYKLIDITINQDVIDLFFEDEIENDDYI